MPTGRGPGPTSSRATIRAIARSSITRGDRYGVQAERLVVGTNFLPEVGFVRRRNMRRNYGQLRFSPRPKDNKYIRRYFGMTSLIYIENSAGRLETRTWDSEFALEFQNNDRVFVAATDNYEFLPAPFTIATDVTLKVQAYQFQSARAGFILGPQRRLAGNFSVEHGTFYNGHKTAFTWTRGRAYVTPQLSFEPRISIDRVELLEGAFTNRLFGTRATYTVTPMMFVSALVQYNSAVDQASANVRLRWEYRPGSELFVVWNEQRDTRQPAFPGAGQPEFCRQDQPPAAVLIAVRHSDTVHPLVPGRQSPVPSNSGDVCAPVRLTRRPPDA